MLDYFIRSVQKADYESIVTVYNSNPLFLLNHLGVERIDESFISEESAIMRNSGFYSCVIVDGGNTSVQGVLDYKPGREVYLSLFMLASELQGKGIGHSIYHAFEQQMRRNGSQTIRIDVVNDYSRHAVPFWKKLGYTEEESLSLTWRNKTRKHLINLHGS